MPIRNYPVRIHGNIPHLDKRIKRTGLTNPEYRWTVNKQYFTTLTDARQYVINKYGLKFLQPLAKEYTYTAAHGYTFVKMNVQKPIELRSNVTYAPMPVDPTLPQMTVGQYAVRLRHNNKVITVYCKESDLENVIKLMKKS